MGSHSVESDGLAETSANFHFVTVSHPNDGKDRRIRRKARSHALKQAVERKRRAQQQSGDNFRLSSATDYSRGVVTKRDARNLVVPPRSLSASKLDPFQSLAVDSSRLQALLGDWNNTAKVRQATEPVFSVSDKLAYQNFCAVFQGGLDDPALANAIMLTLAFAATGGSIDGECLWYQSQAIGYIRERMDSLDRATSTSTIGAILLLAGVDARLGMQNQVQLHMRAVQQLLDICRVGGLYLTDGIKRAIFWQDLNASVMTGSSRVVNHTTFAELQWKRDPFLPTFFELPPGFRKLSHLLTQDFIDVLEDINALQCIREFARPSSGYLISMAHINNHQASIQSRLKGLYKASLVVECCYLAAYLCSSMLCCKVWCALVIPSHISSKLLFTLELAEKDPVWDKHPELLLWLLYIGGAFASDAVTRSGYVRALRERHSSRYTSRSTSWQKVLQIMKQFIWSDDAFIPHVKTFWKEVSV
ncbi:uncharacterized protein E0L32_004070 [Thyridium curvatum]|uniref:Uncharacterized protein n=1 Tax=Thyridium curvatum TaxID=1093900 RepID=A0A507AZ21_9PEZI|nr:uncharacterized protein E0L32_004070 [Thyridium curvatum]TPX16075.1 hypothetical protein E0L32_004070 [Thyridium curvatum]